MFLAVLLTVCVAWAVVWAGSYRNYTLIAAVVLTGCFVVAAVVSLVCNALAIPRHEWQAPIILFGPLPVLGILAVYAGRICDPIRAADVRRVASQAIAERRRRAAIRADVRRRVSRYKVEVS